MAIAFPRSLRALDNDRFRPSRLALTFASLLLLLWMGWFFFGQNPVYETSTRFTLTREGLIAASFPAAAMARFSNEQPASIRIETGKDTVQTFDGSVYRVEPGREGEDGQVLIYLDDQIALPSKPQGQIQIQVEAESPAQLVLRAIRVREPDPTAPPAETAP